MAAPKKYSDELRERAVRMVVDARRDPETRQGAIARIAGQLGIKAETLRTWVKRTEIDEGLRPGTTSQDAMRIAALERENRELKRADEILKTASASSRRRSSTARSSSTADCGAGRVHRPAPRQVRGRADLCGAG